MPHTARQPEAVPQPICERYPWGSLLPRFVAMLQEVTHAH